tara:strand:- start:826 stop:990 length:165 start_codon:yes stop_codon:yes gene_type:complete
MDFIRNFFGGLASMFNITTSPLYRYPYYNSAEGLRGDMLRIGKDIEFVFEKEEE